LTQDEGREVKEGAGRPLARAEEKEKGEDED